MWMKFSDIFNMTRRPDGYHFPIFDTPHVHTKVQYALRLVSNYSGDHNHRIPPLIGTSEDYERLVLGGWGAKVSRLGECFFDSSKIDANNSAHYLLNTPDINYKIFVDLVDLLGLSLNGTMFYLSLRGKTWSLVCLNQSGVIKEIGKIFMPLHENGRNIEPEIKDLRAYCHAETGMMAFIYGHRLCNLDPFTIKINCYRPDGLPIRPWIFVRDALARSAEGADRLSPECRFI